VTQLSYQPSQNPPASTFHGTPSPVVRRRHSQPQIYRLVLFGTRVVENNLRYRQSTSGFEKPSSLKENPVLILRSIDNITQLEMMTSTDASGRRILSTPSPRPKIQRSRYQTCAESLRLERASLVSCQGRMLFLWGLHAARTVAHQFHQMIRGPVRSAPASVELNLLGSHNPRRR